MSTARTISAVVRSKQFKNLEERGLSLVSTDRQLSNGTLAFYGKTKLGRKTVPLRYSITANGAVISNEFVARRVTGETASETYRNGMSAISELFDKRFSA